MHFQKQQPPAGRVTQKPHTRTHPFSLPAHLLTLSAPFTALFCPTAHPGLGKGFLGNVAVSGNGTADSGAAAAGNGTTGATTIALTHPKFAKHSEHTDLSNCQCKDDCQEEKRKVCKSREVAKEVCKEEEEEEDVVECETKCFKADKVISIGKGESHTHTQCCMHQLSFTYSLLGLFSLHHCHSALTHHRLCSSDSYHQLASMHGSGPWSSAHCSSSRNTERPQYNMQPKHSSS